LSDGVFDNLGIDLLSYLLPHLGHVGIAYPSPSNGL